MAALDERRCVRPRRDQLCKRVRRTLGLAGTGPGRGRLCERAQMGGGLVVKPQCPGERVDHLRGGMVVAALLQPQVVIRADAGEHSQLLAPQPRNAPAAGGGKLDLLGAHQLTPRPQYSPKAVLDGMPRRYAVPLGRIRVTDRTGRARRRRQAWAYRAFSLPFTRWGRCDQTMPS